MRLNEILDETPNELDATLNDIANYIIHLEDINFKNAHRILVKHGYKEIVPAGTYFRALSHEITEQDRARFKTMKDMLPSLQREIRMDIKGPEGFTTSLENAAHFAMGNMFYQYDNWENSPQYQPSKNISDIKSIWLIYEVVAPQNSILFSMKGLNAFLKTVPNGPGKAALLVAINDIWDGYPGDDEVIIDTRGISVRQVHIHYYSVNEETGDWEIGEKE